MNVHTAPKLNAKSIEHWKG